MRRIICLGTKTGSSADVKLFPWSRRSWCLSQSHRNLHAWALFTLRMGNNLNAKGEREGEKAEVEKKRRTSARLWIPGGLISVVTIQTETNTYQHVPATRPPGYITFRVHTHLTTDWRGACSFATNYMIDKFIYLLSAAAYGVFEKFTFFLLFNAYKHFI